MVGVLREYCRVFSDQNVKEICVFLTSYLSTYFSFSEHITTFFASFLEVGPMTCMVVEEDKYQTVNR